VSDEKPRKGDKVRVSYEAMYDDPPNYPGLIVSLGIDVDGNERWADVPPWATVEVLERADDPSKDLVGAIRRQPSGGSEEGNGSALGVVAIRWATERQTDTPWVYMRWDGPQVLSNESVVGWTPSGCLPGTPAAEAEKAAGHCESCECTHPVCGYVLGSAACEESHEQEYPDVSGAGVPFPPSTTDAPPLPEVDNEAIETGLYYAEKARQRREPRVFRSEGPEPPDTKLGPALWVGGSSEEPPPHVIKVADRQGDRLHRNEHGWVGEGGDGYPLIIKAWERHVLPKCEPYTEVRS
jgi:hypothetical protein